ncbi:MAG: hypothetical protein FWH08_06060 [Oscillospiraceae bacterium]|nr:hypothetical protein [Oscillospiraceae bacterium]
MKKSSKKKILLSVIIIISLFILLNVSWFIWRGVKYGGYVVNMGKTDSSSFMNPRYYSEDADRYGYYVRYPGYLSFKGSLTVMEPSRDGSSFENTFIIRTFFGDGYEFVLILYEDGEAYELTLRSASPDDEMTELLDKNRGVISELEERAFRKWDIRTTKT